MSGLVMGLLAVLAVMALSLGAATRADLEQTRRFQDETAAELLAKAGIDWTIHYLIRSNGRGRCGKRPGPASQPCFRSGP